MRRLLFALLLLALLAVPSAHTEQVSLPGCEAPAALRKIIKDQLESKEFRHLPYQEQQERKQNVLSGLIAKYPREALPWRRLIVDPQNMREYDLDPLTTLQKQLHAQQAAHPDDPLPLYLYASALRGTDTPESIRMLEKAQSLAPAFVWPSLDLAQIYSSGKFADKQKFTDQLTKFFTACPISQDDYAYWMLVKIPELEAKVAKANRASLEKAKDPERLKDYEFLWGMEFRATSPKDFPALRQQVATDLKRLEHANPHPDAEWVQVLINGSKQAGAAPESIRAKEDALIAAYPHSGEAHRIAFKRWQAAHPEPTDQKDPAAWKTYNQAFGAMQLALISQYPEASFPPDIFRFFAMQNDDALSETQGVDLVTRYLNAGATYWPPFFRENANSAAASYLLEHKWKPEQALEYLEESRKWSDRAGAAYAAEDDHSEADLKEHAEEMAKWARYMENQTLLAAMRANRPDAITPDMKASIEAPRTADDKDESAYWLRRARLAAVEGRQQDGLGYYQLALRSRPKPPSYERGKLTDELTDEAHALWTKLGGTEVAWSAWSAPTTAPNAAKADEARWEKPTKTLPDFQLSDLSGKTWTTKSLNGKVVLINLWATWCGPCNAELPQLQKLYEQAKNRSDFQILTFNIDEDLGLVEPFMKEKGYTFPVVPAYSYVVNLVNGYAIPQNWVLNPKGAWEWTQIGYGSDDAWVKDMLAKLDAVKAGG
jgi:thiol-disulfide isomerase/thioredoxin